MNKDTIYKSLKQVQEELTKEFQGFMPCSEVALLPDTFADVLSDVLLVGCDHIESLKIH